MPYNHLSKEETLEELDNAMTVADLIAKLSRMDPDLIVTNFLATLFQFTLHYGSDNIAIIL